MSGPIPPLRIQKNGQMPGMASLRPLAEISPMERRRNSPSYNQTSRKPMFEPEDSPHKHWQKASLAQQDAENSPKKRSSIENLKRASRVKNNNIFVEQTKPVGYRQTNVERSPSKSSMSATSKYARPPPFDPRKNIWADEDASIQDRKLPPGKVLHRHAKSVTFDAAPPRIQEYEQSTPAPSSIASGSRDGSPESQDNSDDSFECDPVADREDSFDAALEDTVKTPVVLPEQWDSPRSSPASEVRPLPPLPGRARSLSAAERIDHSQRDTQTPPLAASISKTELQNMSGCSMSMEERLRLMMLDSKSTPDPFRSEEPDDYILPPRISRESILQKVNGGLASLPSSQPPGPASALDPDTPLPSIETEIKQEPEEDDVFSIPELYNQQLAANSVMDAVGKLQAIKASREMTDEEDDGSHYSTDYLPPMDLTRGFLCNSESFESIETPKATPQEEMSLPRFASLLSVEEGETIEAPFSRVPPVPSAAGGETVETALSQVTPNFDMGMIQLAEPAVAVIDSPEHSTPRTCTPPVLEEVPEPVATIKASGSKLKTRPSATPSDIAAMAEVRRQVSAERPPLSVHGSLRDQARPSMVMEEPAMGEEECLKREVDHRRKDSAVSLDVPIAGSESIDIENEFDRLIEAQKKGYMMRQNTKVIVASSTSYDTLSAKDEAAARATRSAGNSPRKVSDTKAWTTEPWNGKTRRKSIRKSGMATKAVIDGPVPPLPGSRSNVDMAESTLEINKADDGERGRLFIKVVRVKDLDLPLSDEKSYFALTLDNGLHCVTTSWLDLAKTAPIGQEFELVVLNELEFQLTLQTKIEEPKQKQVPTSPTKPSKIAKPSPFSRVFASPRKRKEMEVRQQQEQQKEDSKPAASHWDLLHNLVAKDGSFSRSYVCLKDFEDDAFGRQITLDVPCFNEWATEESSQVSNSARSKRSATVQRRPPYKVGKLELQLLYVPKPKGAKDEDMPKSMNACLRELKDAQNAGSTKREGHLSQQGGDCPYWRRRFFSLNGSKLTAYHEATRQPRATINLAKASKLIDDKSSLMNPGKGNRRKSAFAEEEEGYMFVEEGFRVRFANGETIDFYADSAAEKDAWMRTLAEVVGKDLTKSKRWTDLILERHRAAPTTSSSKRSLETVPEDGGHRREGEVSSRRAAIASKTRSMIF